MRTQIPVHRLIPTIAGAIATIFLLIFLNNSFGGPQIPPRNPYELTATFRDSQNIVKKSLVMYRGVKVGEVTDVEIEDGRAHVKFTVYDEYRPVREGAAAQIGHRTIFGEAFVNLHPGRRDGAEIPDGTELRSLYTVQPDEALRVFDPRTRESLASSAREVARGLRSPAAGRRLNDTYGAGWQAVTKLRRVTDALRGQERELASLVASSATVLDTLGEDSGAVRRIVGSGRTVLETLAAEREGLGESIDELHGLLGEAREVLPRARPLLEEGERLGREGIRMAKALTPALVQLAPLTRESRIVVQSLTPANRVAVPALTSLSNAMRNLEPVAEQLGPLFANLVAILDYIRPRLRDITGTFATAADSFDNGDSEGVWLRGFLSIEPRAGTLPPQGCESPEGLCTNAYPKPGDALDPREYEPGTYPRLRPFRP